VAYSFVLSIPVVGDWLAFLIFGGEFPAHDILRRLFVIHILLVPLAILGLLSVHLAILWRQKHTQFRGRGREEHNVVGSKLWPTYALKSVGLLALVTSVLTFLGGLVQINPVWLYGPFKPAAVSTAAQPDWYLGWTEGAIRLFPPWFARPFGYSIPEVFWPSIFLPGVTFALLYAWPFLEARVTHDHAEHHLLDRPSDRPIRSAIGVGALTFFVVLTAAGGQDIIAQKLQTDIAPVTFTLRVLTLVLPFVVGLFTWKVCHDIRASGHIAESQARTEAPIGPYEDPPEEPDQVRAGAAHSPTAEVRTGAEASTHSHPHGRGATAVAAAIAVGIIWWQRRRTVRRG
jgi:ubiquinol-cytochrome c reductase cytochrome b subunit